MPHMEKLIGTGRLILRKFDAGDVEALDQLCSRPENYSLRPEHAGGLALAGARADEDGRSPHDLTDQQEVEDQAD
jgi:hypothetical protein